MSPSEPRRTTTKRWSAMGPFPNGVEECARGVFLRIADDGYADTEAIGGCALRNSFRAVVRAFCVNVRTDIFEQGFDIGLCEEHHEIDIAQRGYQLRAGLFVENGPARPLQAADAGVRIDRYNQNIAFAFCPGKIADVAHMQRIEAAVGQHDSLALSLQFTDGGTDKFARMNFGLGGPHRKCLEGHLRSSLSNGFQEFVARHRSCSPLHDHEATRDIRNMCRFDRESAAGQAESVGGKN